MLQQLANGGRDGDAHLLGRDGGELHPAKQTQDGQTAACRFSRFHHHHRGGAVGKLRGVARRRRAAGIHGFERSERGEGRVGARPFVVIEGDLFLVARLGRLVGHPHLGGERNDLLGELAGSRRGGHALLALDDVSVLRFAGDAVFLRHEVGRLVHGPPHGRHPLLERLVEEAVEVEAELHERDALHAAGDPDGHLARRDPIGDDGRRAEARAAVAVHGHPGDGFAEAGLQRGVAGDVVSGRPLGKAASDDDVLDLASVDARPLDAAAEDVRGHRDPVRLVERSALRPGDPRPTIRHHRDVLHRPILHLLTPRRNRRRARGSRGTRAMDGLRQELLELAIRAPPPLRPLPSTPGWR